MFFMFCFFAGRPVCPAAAWQDAPQQPGWFNVDKLPLQHLSRPLAFVPLRTPLSTPPISAANRLDVPVQTVHRVVRACRRALFFFKPRKRRNADLFAKVQISVYVKPAWQNANHSANGGFA